MATDFTTELGRFHQFVRDCLDGPRASLSPEEALDLWRVQHPTLEEFESSLRAVREAIEDMERGDRGVTIEEFERDFRMRNGLPLET